MAIALAPVIRIAETASNAHRNPRRGRNPTKVPERILMARPHLFVRESRYDNVHFLPKFLKRTASSAPAERGTDPATNRAPAAERIVPLRCEIGAV